MRVQYLARGFGFWVNSACTPWIFQKGKGFVKEEILIESVGACKRALGNAATDNQEYCQSPETSRPICTS